MPWETDGDQWKDGNVDWDQVFSNLKQCPHPLPADIVETGAEMFGWQLRLLKEFSSGNAPKHLVDAIMTLIDAWYGEVAERIALTAEYRVAPPLSLVLGTLDMVGMGIGRSVGEYAEEVMGVEQAAEIGRLTDRHIEAVLNAYARAATGEEPNVVVADAGAGFLSREDVTGYPVNDLD